MRNAFPYVAIFILAVIVAVILIGATGDPNNPNAPIIQITRNDVQEIADTTVEATEQITETTTTQFEQFLNRLIQPPSSVISQLVLIVGGIILLFFGWRIYDIIIVLAGALVGASLASAMVVTNSAFVEIAALLIGGLLGAFLAMFLYYIAVFLIGMYVGIVLTVGLTSLFNITPVSPLILIVGAIIGGFLILALSGELVIFASALVGAQMITTGLGLNREWMLLLVIIGIAVQILAIRYYSINLRRRPRRVWLRAR